MSKARKRAANAPARRMFRVGDLYSCLLDGPKTFQTAASAGILFTLSNDKGGGKLKAARGAGGGLTLIESDEALRWLPMYTQRDAWPTITTGRGSDM
jgi:hypothetical protein